MVYFIKFQIARPEPAVIAQTTKVKKAARRPPTPNGVNSNGIMTSAPKEYHISQKNMEKKVSTIAKAVLVSIFLKSSDVGLSLLNR